MLYKSIFVLEFNNIKNNTVMKTNFSPIFMLTWALVLTGLWIVQPIESASPILEYIFVGIILIFFLIGFYLGYSRNKRKKQGFPDEDELSKKIVQKAAAISFYSSILLWLLLIYLYSHLQIEIKWLLSIGMIGMAILFISIWLVINNIGIKNEK